MVRFIVIMMTPTTACFVTVCVQGLLLMLCTSVVPSIMLLLSRRQRRRDHWRKGFRMACKVFDLLACGGQLSACILWPILTLSDLNKYDKNLIWAIPLSLICISIRWWENFLEKPESWRTLDNDESSRRPFCTCISKFGWRVHNTIWDMACEIYEARIKIDLILSVWKILLSFGLMIGMVGLQLNDWNAVFSLDSRYRYS